MAVARTRQIHLESTRYYHCISRCVRRAYLCGNDKLTGKNFDHRKTWLVERMKLLSRQFGIDICAYAVMSNHFHIVLHVDCERVVNWSDEEVIRRWAGVYKHPLARKFCAGDVLHAAEHLVLDLLIPVWRERLMDISWFMRSLNEVIARRANQEDECTGRFWEGRFKSRALLDEGALLTCMAYVDLNPVRAGLANSPEAADFTSIQERILAHKTESPLCETLLRFQDSALSDDNPSLPFLFSDYLALVDWVGRSSLDEAAGSMHSGNALILRRLQLRDLQWCRQVYVFDAKFYQVAGSIAAIRASRRFAVDAG